MAHLGLALVDTVDIRGLRIVEESHRGSRAVDASGTSAAATRVIDLSHRIRAGLVTHPGLPAPVITPHLTGGASREKYASGTELAMDVITMIDNTGTCAPRGWLRCRRERPLPTPRHWRRRCPNSTKALSRGASER